MEKACLSRVACASRSKPADRILMMLLLASFVVTVMVPLTGVTIHKLASVLFLLLCAIHTVRCRKKLNRRWIGLLALVLVSFVSGVLGMMNRETPFMLAFHEAVSIGSVFFLAIHIFTFHRKLRI